MPTVVVRDSTMSGVETSTLALDDLPHRLPLRELVRWRVREEVARANAHTGLVDPSPHDSEADVSTSGRTPRVDWEVEAARALKAFEQNGFVVLIGDRQVEDLDEMVELDDDPDIVFIRLHPLAGG